MRMQSVEIVLKSFLNTLPQERQTELLRLVPKETQERLEAISTDQREYSGSFFDIVHWSWFIPTLKTYSQNEQKLFLRALDGATQESLREELKLENPLEPLSQTGELFFKQVLLTSLTGARDRLLPIEYLPTSPVKELLHLSKKTLIHLIDFLSLFDLAHELRQIVETKILKRIYSLLSKEKRNFLKVAMAYKESFASSKIGLDRWEGPKEAFNTLLHRRGLMRLGTALSHQHPDLVWYFCHRLDIGRGNTLFKLSQKEVSSSMAEQAVRQLEEVLRSLVHEQ